MLIQVQQESVGKTFLQRVSQRQGLSIRLHGTLASSWLFVFLSSFSFLPILVLLCLGISPAFFSALTKCHTWHSRWKAVHTLGCLPNHQLLHWDGFFNTESTNKDPKCLRENDWTHESSSNINFYFPHCKIWWKLLGKQGPDGVPICRELSFLFLW